MSLLPWFLLLVSASLALGFPFSDKGVIISNPGGFEEKLKDFIDGGAPSLQVISDFDRTLTCFFMEDKLCASSHGVIANNPFFGPDFEAKAQRLYETYYPLEISPNLDNDTKFQKMQEWWTQSHELMREHGLKRSHIPLALENSPIDLRKGTPELFKLLQRENVPIMIFSAGISEVINEFLSQKGILLDNVEVVSNEMIFDEEATLQGFGEQIHSLNKNAQIISKLKPSWSCDPSRKNILLLGDNVTDIHMPEGLHFSEMISIGFLNDKAEERLQVFKETFDVVILNDGPMDFVHSLLHQMVPSHPLPFRSSL